MTAIKRFISQDFDPKRCPNCGSVRTQAWDYGQRECRECCHDYDPAKERAKAEEAERLKYNTFRE